MKVNEAKVYEGPRGKWTERLEIMKENPGQWFLFPMSRGRNGGSLDYGRGYYVIRKAMDEAGESRDDFQFTTRNLPYIEGEKIAVSVLLGRYVGPEFVESLRPEPYEPLEERLPDPTEPDDPEDRELEEDYRMSENEGLLLNLATALTELRREVRELKEERSAR